MNLLADRDRKGPGVRLLFVDTTGSGGGAERSMFELASALSEMSWSFSVEAAAVLPDGAAVSWFLGRGMKVFPCRFARLRRPSLLHPFRKTGLLSLFSIRRSISTAAKSFFADGDRNFVIANNFAALLSAPSFPGCRIVWHLRDLPRRRQVRIGAAKADYIFAISEYVYSALLEMVPAEVRHKVYLVKNGIDRTRFADAAGRSPHDFRCEFSIPEPSRIVAMASNLVPWKRHELFVEAAEIIRRSAPDTVFFIAGSDLFGEHGDYVAKLKAAAVRYNFVKNLVFPCRQVNMAELFRCCNVFVHPAECEPFGRVVCEAMACGVPVVVSSRGGPATFVDNGKTGLLVDGENAADWAEAVLRLLGDRNLACRLSARASEIVPDILATAERAIEILCGE